MEFSNFRNWRTFGGPKYDFAFAEVDVTTGWLFWKKTVTRPIAKAAYIWRFEDDGKFCPKPQIDNLEAAFRMKRLKQACEEGNLLK